MLPLPKGVKAFVKRFSGNVMEEQKFYYYRNSDQFFKISFELLFKLSTTRLTQ